MDICLILEGTYPYVTGGVSSCVYQLIRELEKDNKKFSLVYIGAKEDENQEYKYPIPKNVKQIKEVYLYDYDIKGSEVKKDLGVDLSLLRDMHQCFSTGDYSYFETFYHKYFNPSTRKFDPIDLLSSIDAWTYLEKVHSKSGLSDKISFIDYFYTWRFSHYPIFKILSLELPSAHVYHSMSTGYAGLLGCVAKMRHQKPLILSEHGIYSNEREIEISQSDWVYENENDFMAKRTFSFFKNWWINIFHFMGKVTYYNSDLITSLYYGNKEKQIKYGADPKKISIVPNGINYKRFSSLKPLLDESVVTISLVGRVVPIKDIKTFIKVINILYLDNKNIKVLILGPTEEDEDYYTECVEMVEFFELSKVIKFLGKVDVLEYYPKIDILCLTSISEGQPLVLLEAFAAGIPAVATDVGACSEMVLGMSEEDKLMGPCGAIAPFGDAEKIASVFRPLIESKDLRNKMGSIAQERVRKYYTEKTNIDRYLTIYEHYDT